MERFKLLALVLASTAAGGCAGLFGRPVDPSMYAYSRGQGQIVFQLPLAVVVEELDRSLTEAGSQVTFRHIDRQGAIVKAKTKDGKAVEATLKVEGMLTQLSLKVGRWGDREATESLLNKVNKGVRAPVSDVDRLEEAGPSEKGPPQLKAASGKAPARGEGQALKSGGAPPN